MWVSTKQSERCASSTVHNTAGVHTAIRTPTDLTLVPQFLRALSVVTQCTHRWPVYDHTSLTDYNVQVQQASTVVLCANTVCTLTFLSSMSNTKIDLVTTG